MIYVVAYIGRIVKSLILKSSNKCRSLYSERNLVKILENLVSDEFIEEHQNKISRQHHTYDYKVFNIMKKLDIGYYTFAFLDHNCRKMVDEIKSPEECREELIHIKNTFTVINNSNISQDIPILCSKMKIPYRTNIAKQMVSNHGSVESYGFDEELLNKIRHKDRFMYEIFGDLYVQ